MTPYHGKRAFDLALVLLSSPLWVPLLLIVAVLVRIKLGSPVFFLQARIGLKDREFNLIKFRTMTDGRNEFGELLPDAERLPPFGKWLRSTSLDELPELWNVLRGDMSLVGPRPLLAQYLPLYSAHHRRRHEVRPGITGLAQTSGRNALTWPRRFDLDVQYVEQASMSLDARILVKTIRELVNRRGISAPGEATMSYFTGYSSPERSRTVSGTIQLRDPDRPQ
jgi:lipopolysaccharide/colanic/teichoic acid biosynthesis glycosyltransferase